MRTAGASPLSLLPAVLPAVAAVGALLAPIAAAGPVCFVTVAGTSRTVPAANLDAIPAWTGLFLP